MQLLKIDELSWLAEQHIGEIVTVQEFIDSRTNQVFLLETDNQQHHYIFKRLNRKARDRRDRQSELLVQKLASDRDLSPKILASCDDYRLQEYFQGETIDCSATEHCTELLASQLHRIHQLPALHAQRQHLAIELQKLKDQLTQAIDEPRFERFLQQAKQLDKSCCADVLCHGDLSFNNLLQNKNQQIKILDWEYVVLACSAYDLAACSSINGLNQALQMQLIEHYYLLNQEKLSLSLSQLKQQYALYLSLFTYLNELWLLVFP
ncbi:phosphotransferase [Psychromonas antarctica]|uniref:phosphotransferase n=1 Tax=Psychromonas antarctica TaxID=67573 RepID=UPI001EE7F671|nr:phosphotransferase [Psychromonas antarctica]MCG6200930.1 phosphotransferase [Psychromonas antarctica]